MKKKSITILASILVLAMVLSVMLVACNFQPVDHTGQAQPPSGSMEGKNYLDVKTMFEQAGFTNIRLEEIDDLIVGWLHDEGDVEEVSVGGDTNYSSYKWYPTDIQVIIRYHVFPKDDTDDNNQNNGNQNTGNGNTGNQNEILTVENCPELAHILSIEAQYAQSYVDFAKKYAGRTIQIEAYIWYITLTEGYTTRYNFLLNAGDYNFDSPIGPWIAFINVNTYDLGSDELFMEDAFWQGQNVLITAKIIEYNTANTMLWLDPILVVEI